MIPLIERHKDAVVDLCRRFGVIRLDLIGSAVTGAVREEDRDLDLVAVFADTRVPEYADRFLGFADALEALFGRPVDVFTERSIRNPYLRRSIEAARQPVYERRDEEAVA
jgi:predicted nucleotidyltransferase